MEQIKCACGCGNILNKYNKQGKMIRYIHGHNLRNITNPGNRFKRGHIPWSKGLTKKDDKRLLSVSEKTRKRRLGSKISQEHILKLHMGLKKKMKGKTYKQIYGNEKSELIKEKLSHSIKKAYKKGLKFGFQKGHTISKGENNPFYGKTHSEETIKKISEIQKGKHTSPSTEFKKGNKLRLGMLHNEESKLKMSKSHKGPNPKTSETRKRLIKEGKIQKGIFKPLELHPDWKGGISFEPYTLDFNNKFKEKIRERDNHTCMLCNKLQEELNYRLLVHHIDYNKLNSLPQNCICLCRICHNLTNINRNIWTTHFQSLLKELYQYQYTEDQKIILDFK